MLLGQRMLGTLEDKALFFHDLPDPGFAQQYAHFSGHVGSYPSNGPYCKRVAHVLGIGFDDFDKPVAVVRRSRGRTTRTILVEKSLTALRLEGVEPIVDTLPVASDISEIWVTE